MIYYMVTGKNAAGSLINAGPTLPRRATYQAAEKLESTASPEPPVRCLRVDVLQCGVPLARGSESALRAHSYLESRDQRERNN